MPTHFLVPSDCRTGVEGSAVGAGQVLKHSLYAIAFW
jgi:hypothetical protein